jgi:hypothetical protein
LFFLNDGSVEEHIVEKFAIRSLFGFVIAVCIAFGLLPAIEQTASCAECESDNLSGIKKAFQAFDEQCAKQLAVERNACFASNTYNKILPIMKALGKNDRFGPSSRILVVGESQAGNLVAGATRGYQTAAPLDKDSVTVKFTADGGSLVKICSVSEDGSMKRVGTISLAEKDEGGEKTAAISGIRGKIIRIDIASGAGKKLQYKFAVS